MAVSRQFSPPPFRQPSPSHPHHRLAKSTAATDKTRRASATRRTSDLALKVIASPSKGTPTFNNKIKSLRTPQARHSVFQPPSSIPVEPASKTQSVHSLSLGPRTTTTLFLLVVGSTEASQNTRPAARQATISACQNLANPLRCENCAFSPDYYTNHPLVEPAPPLLLLVARSWTSFLACR